MLGIMIGIVKGDTRSLDYGSIADEYLFYSWGLSPGVPKGKGQPGDVQENSSNKYMS